MLYPEDFFIKDNTILIIDDSPLIHKIVRRILTDSYKIESCFCGKEAIRRINEIKPSLIFLDVDMPEMNGFETIEKLKVMDICKDVPIIFLTGTNDILFEIKALSLGAVDYINKPFAEELLRKKVEIYLAYTKQKETLSLYNENLQKMVKEKTKIIKELQSAIVFALSDLVEMRDDLTGGHIQRTQAYYELILDALEKKQIYSDELKDVDHQQLVEASQLHDIGKVAIPDAILCKPGKLTIEEFDIMKRHTIMGHNAVLKAMELTSEKEFLKFAAQVALYHHEKWSGKGYPKGLSQLEIPIAARIMSVVDVYDALVSERHYKKKMTHEQAMEILIEGRGTDFDPILIDIFLELNEKFKEISNQ
ncbi:MAG: HD domain-containing phosphohydrolase [Anaerotignaceae bacterium]